LSEPSYLINLVLSAVASQPSAAAGMQATMQRATEFPSPLHAQLAGIALDPSVGPPPIRSSIPSGPTKPAGTIC